MQNFNIAIGPMIGLPSTEWVGKDIAEEMNKILNNVTLFSSFEEEITADVIIIIKLMPSLKWLKEKLRQNKKTIYIPIDFFSADYKIIQHKQKLKHFDSIAIHNNRLGNELRRYNSEVYFIEHYLKYELQPYPSYKAQGDILWVGHLEYLPALIIRLNKINLKNNIVVLVDLENIDNKRAAMKAELLSEKINWKEKIGWENMKRPELFEIIFQLYQIYQYCKNF